MIFSYYNYNYPIFKCPLYFKFRIFILIYSNSFPIYKYLYLDNRSDNSFKKIYLDEKFPYSKNIGNFDFAFQPSIDKTTINDLRT